jgi:hypothetical protein
MLRCRLVGMISRVKGGTGKEKETYFDVVSGYKGRLPADSHPTWIIEFVLSMSRSGDPGASPGIGGK